MKIAFRLYKLVKPLFDRLERRYRREIRRLQQLEAFKLGEQLFRNYEANKNPDKVKSLRRQPPIGGCSHLKGVGPYRGPNDESYGSKFPARDYNVSFHTFVDGRARVRCNRCGETRWQGEPGFEEFLNMVHQSTNTQSSSEHIIKKDGK
jgi:hypothetical protein